MLGVAMRATDTILTAVQDQYGASGCCSSGQCSSPESTAAETSPVHDGLAEVLQRFDANQYAASVSVHALKSNNHSRREVTMKTIQVYDKPMCCSTGICGPSVDPVLPQFAADLDWLKGQGHQVERYNLAQQPQAFIQNATVHQLLATEGTNCLPLILVDGQVVSRRDYPSREILSLWIHPTLPVVGTDCCGGPARDAGSACCAADQQAKITTVAGCGCAETGCC